MFLARRALVPLGTQRRSLASPLRAHQRGVRWQHGHSSFDFLEECNRWESFLTKDLTPDECSNEMLYVLKSEWEQHLDLIKEENRHQYDWWKAAPSKGVVRIPRTGALTKPQHLLRLLNSDLDNDTTMRCLTNNMDDLVAYMKDTEEELGPFSFQPFSKDQPPLSDKQIEECIISYLLQSYSFDRYKTSTSPNSRARIAFPETTQRQETLALIRATYFVQDLISTPAMDLTPGALQRVTEALVDQHKDRLSVQTIVGGDLLDYHGSLPTGGCGMIYGVGQAANQEDRQPRLICIQYRPPSSGENKISLVGKGVTYDTGGLNLKPGASMLHMKKDMGGAAHVLGLLMALNELDYPHSIDAWIPAVENVVDGSSYRPGDILTSVNGTTTEIGNTDAEGRLVLADALALASAEEPDLIVDFATLTGAARVAMGTDVVPYFTNTAAYMERINQAAIQMHDPMWPLPVWEGYRERIKSKIADLRNVPNDNGLGGAITAALYLQEFVGKQDNKAIPWIHLDVYGIAGTSGIGMAQGLRSMYRFLWDHDFQ